MPMSFIDSKLARLFLDLYGAATLRGAVEKAAESMQPAVLPGFEPWANVPIDVDDIAMARGMLAGPALATNGCAEGKLQPTRDGFVYSVKGERHEYRRRFSVAHEIGHTLFYENTGAGPRHRYGLLNRVELKAEEYICNLFAGALLVPLAVLRSFTPLAHLWDATTLLRNVERLRAKFHVSRAVLLRRLAESLSSHPSRVVIEFRFVENSQTNRTPDLRAVDSTALGAARGRYWVWSNRTPKGLNLRSVNQLFELWDKSHESVKRAGWYTLSEDSITPWADSPLPEHAECVELGESRAGRWRTIKRPARVATCLLSSEGGGERDLSVFAVLDLDQESTLS